MNCPDCGSRVRVIDSRPGDAPLTQERLFQCAGCRAVYFIHSAPTASSLPYRLAAAKAAAESRRKKLLKGNSGIR